MTEIWEHCGSEKLHFPHVWRNDEGGYRSCLGTNNYGPLEPAPLEDAQ